MDRRVIHAGEDPVTRELASDLDLFGEPRQKRRPNLQKSTKAEDIVLRWRMRPDERKALHWNEKAEGGYQQTENEVILGIDTHPDTVPGKRYFIEINEKLAWKLMRYIQGHGGGGPNNRLRVAFSRFIRPGTWDPIWGA